MTGMGVDQRPWVGPLGWCRPPCLVRPVDLAGGRRRRRRWRDSAAGVAWGGFGAVRAGYAAVCRLVQFVEKTGPAGLFAGDHGRPRQCDAEPDPGDHDHAGCACEQLPHGVHRPGVAAARRQVVSLARW